VVTEKEDVRDSRVFLIFSKVITDILCKGTDRLS
jgi:hypothetical protein